MLIGLAAIATPATSYETTRPAVLTTLAADAVDPKVRCYAFFLAVNAMWAMSKQYGSDRDVFQWSFDHKLYETYNDDEKEQVKASGYVARYIETLTADADSLDVNPVANSVHQIYVADKAFCAPSADKTS